MVFVVLRKLFIIYFDKFGKHVISVGI